MVAIDFGWARKPALPWGFSRSAARHRVGGVPPTVLVLAGIVSVQVGAAVAKQLFAATGPAGAVSLRLFFAGVVLLVCWRSSLRIERRALPVVLAYGAILAVMNLAFYEAIDRIPLGMAVTLEFLGPLVVALAHSRRWIDPVWAVLAGGGVLLLTHADGPVLWTGVLFALAAGACWGSYILVGAKLGEKTSGGGGLAIAMAFGGLLSAPMGILGAGASLLQPSVLLAGFGVALLSSVVPYSVELEALRRIPPRVFGVLMSLEPAVAALAGLVVLGQLMNFAQWAGIACVVAASAGATRTGR
ncbi:EamA family transporter [Nocardia terpenica]|uniref:EamA family transporter n=1 Tax=Nocardia terpenica TaxID=455432 RepID=UPI00189306B7|nr:EamA family transporter [Nocardia terpenica]MBF6063817.1 EamA family transporter [Nocardia terpenica]MBF6108531.1 EamA family transporter [Nocardia terpenica]MBF6116077.1 EamA family transporter [Nocardia terpenica]MBF6120998.1 EamA family transporter [Nocardia terpenica]MBF6156730.1 EamA family transporter [Nocardia terpenica]